MLIPYLDLANNALIWDPDTLSYKNINGFDTLEAVTSPDGRGSPRAWVERAMHNYEEGEEVFGTYSMSKGTVSYLLQYGYVTRGNMNDRILLSLPGRAREGWTECYVMRDYVVPQWFVEHVALVRREENVRRRGGRRVQPSREGQEEEELTVDDIMLAKDTIKRSIRNTPIMQSSPVAEDLKLLNLINPAEYSMREAEEFGGEMEGDDTTEVPSLTPGHYFALAYRTEVKIFLERIIQTLEADAVYPWEYQEPPDLSALENVLIVW